MSWTMWMLVILSLFALWNNLNAQGNINYQFGDTPMECPLEWIKYGTTCLLVTKEPLSTWNDARNHCSDTGGWLLEVQDWFLLSNLAENTTINNESYWIGFLLERNVTGTTEELYLKGISGRRYPKYQTLWAPGQPNRSLLQRRPVPTPSSQSVGAPFAQLEEACVALDMHQMAVANGSTAMRGWTTVDCARPLSYICQIDACFETEWRCTGSSVCVNLNRRCDQSEECPNGADERDCPNATSTPAASTAPTLFGAPTSAQRWPQSLQSPNYPRHYPPNVRRDWKLMLDGPQKRILLEFVAFRTESAVDVLQIRDGSSWETAFELGNYSGVWSGHRLRSATNTLLLRFVTDGTVAHSGFNLTWVEDVSLPSCNRDIVVASSEEAEAAMERLGDELFAPERSSAQLSNLRCEWRLSSVDETLPITAVIQQLHLRPGDWLQFHDGPTADGLLLDNFNSSSTVLPSSLRSSSSALTVVFRTAPGGDSTPKLDVRYRSGCRNVTIQKESGTIAHSAGNVGICSWFIKSPVNRPITFLMHRLKLAEGDTIKVFDNGALIKTVDERTKDVRQFSLRSVTGRILVELSTLSAEKPTEFEASFGADCPRFSPTPHLEASPTPTNGYGQVVSFGCALGYSLVSDNFEQLTQLDDEVLVECLADSRWSQQPPRCQINKCLPLPMVANGRLLELTGVTVGSQLRYECHYGYRTEIANATSVCGIDQQWRPQPKCIAIVCTEEPVLPTNAEHVNISATGAPLHGRSHYRCRQGTPWGADFVVCQPNGQWSTPTFQCRPAVCYAHPIAHGHFDRTVYNETDNATLLCQPGFETDTPNVTCLADGTFTFQSECKDVDECAQGSNETNGFCANGICTNLPGGFICNCLPGFTLTSTNATCIDIDECAVEGMSGCSVGCTNTIGSFICDCPRDSTLLTPEMQLEVVGDEAQLLLNRSCVDVRCPLTGDVSLAAFASSDGMVNTAESNSSSSVRLWSENERLKVGVQAVFFCKDGGQTFADRRTIAVRCLAGGVWSEPHVPECQVPQCVAPQQLLHGAFAPVQSSYDAGDVIEYSCADGYRLLEGSRRRVCFQHLDRPAVATWTGRAPTCQKFECDALLRPQHGRLVYTDGRRVGSRAHFYCERGYRRHGERSLLCGSNQLWRGSTPQCIRMQCPRPTVQDSQLVQFQRSNHFGFYENDKVTFKCAVSGYSLSNEEPLRCVSKRTMKLEQSGFSFNRLGTSPPTNSARRISHEQPPSLVLVAEYASGSGTIGECAHVFREAFSEQLQSRTHQLTDCEHTAPLHVGLRPPIDGDEEAVRQAFATSQLLSVEVSVSDGSEQSVNCLRRLRTVIEKQIGVLTPVGVDSCTAQAYLKRDDAVRLLPLDMTVTERRRRSLIDSEVSYTTAANCATVPDITIISSDLQTYVGSSVELICGVQLDDSCSDQYVVEWEKDNVTLSNDARQTLIWNDSEGRLLLRLTQIEPTDSGIYFCRRTDKGEPLHQRSLQLTVVESEDVAPMLFSAGNSNTVHPFGTNPTSIESEHVTVYDSDALRTDELSKELESDWAVYHSGDGKGWIRSNPTEGRLFQVCDSTNLSPNSWLRSPFIHLGTDDQGMPIASALRSVRISVVFVQPPPCRQLNSTVITPPYRCTMDMGPVEVLWWASDRPFPVQHTHAWNINDFDGGATLKPVRSAETVTSDVRRTVRFEIDRPSRAGIYLAFCDRGSCSTLAGVRVFYVRCAQFRVGPTVVGGTYAPAKLAHPVAVPVSCVSGAHPSAIPPAVVHCDSDGKWHSAVGNNTTSDLFTACVCQRGHLMTAHHDCAKKGPLCRRCRNARSIKECDDSAVIDQCLDGEQCQVDIEISNTTGFLLNKHCASIEMCSQTHIDNFTLCLHGRQSCRFCCADDHCNDAPFERQTPDEDKLFWSSDTPHCVDNQPPTLNCSFPGIVRTRKAANGFILPVNIEFPSATDNSGFVLVRTEPKRLSSPIQMNGNVNAMTVLFIAEDAAGQSDSCRVKIVAEDRTAPRLRCPERAVTDYQRLADKQREAAARYPRIQIDDGVKMTITPQNGTMIVVNRLYVVNVTATDEHGNESRCSFRYIIRPSNCPLWSLRGGAPSFCSMTPAQVRVCQLNRFGCPSQRFQPSSVQRQLAVSCQQRGVWRELSPQGGLLLDQTAKQVLLYPTCVEFTTPSVNFTASANYSVGADVTPLCLDSFANVFGQRLVGTFEQHCALTLKEHAGFLAYNTRIEFIPSVLLDHRRAQALLMVNMTVHSLSNETLQQLLGQQSNPLLLCFERFEQFVASNVITSPETLTATGPCPSIKRTANTGAIGSVLKVSLMGVNDCPVGSVRSDGNELGFDKSTLDFVCKACPVGMFADRVKERCAQCPLGSYRSHGGDCLPCPHNGTTLYPYSTTVDDCYAPCPRGWYSESGYEPCHPCSIGTFQNQTGRTACLKCAVGHTTITTATESVENCAVVCLRGTFSENGMSPCTACPIGHYQPGSGASFCLKCPAGTSTTSVAAVVSGDCRPIDSLSCASCSDKGECQFDVVTGASYCECAAGHYGFDCSLTAYHCSSEQQLCANNGTCVQTLGSDARVTITCSCPVGYYGSRCQLEMDPCAADPCGVHGVCQRVDTTEYYCDCFEGWYGDNCTEETNECALGAAVMCGDERSECLPCPRSECNVGYRCNCPKGRWGARCSETMDACEHSPCVNQTSLVCSTHSDDPTSSPHCSCRKGWKGEFCSEPTVDCTDEYCSNNGICRLEVDSSGVALSPICLCAPGFRGERCEQKQLSCREDSCENGGTCTEVGHGFECRCKRGYFDRTCSTHLSVCHSQPCLNGGSCRENMEEKNSLMASNSTGFACTCREGWTGLRCETMIEHCASRPCLNDATCVSVVGGFSCVCQTGTTGDLCSERLTSCRSSPCMTGSTCEDLGNPLGGTFRCLCATGWTGVNCESDIDQCEGVPCGAGGSCVNLGNGKHYCRCPAGFEGPSCQQNIDDCINGTYLCQHGGRCIDEVDGYRCNCAEAYTGQNCEQLIDPCQPSPCQHGGVCQLALATTRRYSCSCPANFTGADCETPVDACMVHNPCQNGGTCVVAAPSKRFVGDGSTADGGGVFCLCPPAFENPHCAKRRSANFNLDFVKVNRSEPLVISSHHFPSRLLRRPFTLCLWVRFSGPDLSATYLSVVNERNTAVVRLSDKGLEHGGGIYKFPINEGRWHHVCILNDQAGIHTTQRALLVYVDSIYSMPAGGMSTTTHDSTYTIRLGGDGEFIGSISLVQLYDRVISKKDIDSMANNCTHWQQQQPFGLHHQPFNDPVVHWINFTKPLKDNPSVVANYPGVCEMSACLPGSMGNECCSVSSCAKQQDKMRPTVDSCPPSRRVTSKQSSLTVRWPEPVFSDNIAIHTVTSNYRNGQAFTWGKFEIVYVATDYANNSAKCVFHLLVSPYTCVTPKAPTNGHMKLVHMPESASDTGVKWYATVGCNEGFAFAEQVRPFYSCGFDGVWDPRYPAEVTFEFPVCTPADNPEQAVSGRIATAHHTCDEENKEQFSANFTRYLLTLNEQHQFCATENCTRELESKVVSCVTSSLTGDRVKRQTAGADDDGGIELRFDFTLNGTTNYSIQRLLNDNLHRMADDSAGAGSLNLLTMDANTTWKCTTERPLADQEGLVFSCAQCPIGSFLQPSTSACAQCPLNQYQNETGQSKCIPCPTDKITPFVGGRSIQDCIDKCAKGHHYNYTEPRGCVACPKGSYQYEVGRIRCIPCPMGTTSTSTGANRKRDCRACPLGQELGNDGSCGVCAVGTYRDRLTQTHCQRCPTGWTNAGAGSGNRSECSIVYCQPGSYVDEAKNPMCSPCRFAFYQQSANKTDCYQCPSGLITRNPGANSVKECRKGSVPYCDLELDDCSSNSNCVNIPGGYDCVCEPGFTGDGKKNGSECTSLCDGHCHKGGGRCSINDTTAEPYCDCYPDFSGITCDIQAASSSDYVILLIAGAVSAAFVAVVFMLVCLMFKTRVCASHRMPLLCCKRQSSLKHISTNQYYRTNTAGNSSANNTATTVATVDGGRPSVAPTANAAAQNDDADDDCDKPNSSGRDPLRRFDRDVYQEIYQGLTNLQADRALTDYLSTSLDDQCRSHSTFRAPPPPILPDTRTSRYEGNSAYYNIHDPSPPTSDFGVTHKETTVWKRYAGDIYTDEHAVPSTSAPIHGYYGRIEREDDPTAFANRSFVPDTNDDDEDADYFG